MYRALIVIVSSCGCCRFQGLLDNLFPGVTIPEATDQDMIAAIHNAAASLQLQTVPEQVHTYA